MTTEAINWLYYSLPKRETPEAVAARVCDALGAAAPSEARRIARAGAKQRFGWTSMSNRFRGADPMDRRRWFEPSRRNATSVDVRSAARTS